MRYWCRRADCGRHAVGTGRWAGPAGTLGGPDGDGEIVGSGRAVVAPEK